MKFLMYVFLSKCVIFITTLFVVNFWYNQYWYLNQCEPLKWAYKYYFQVVWHIYNKMTERVFMTYYQQMSLIALKQAYIKCQP